jgi:anti-anti-sigma factor
MMRLTFDSEGTVGGKNVPPLRRPYPVSISPLPPKWSEPAASIGSSGKFAVTVGFVNAGAVVSVRGEMDRPNSEELGAILDAVIEGHRSIVLDLAELDFISSWGLEAIAVRASRLRRSRGSLTIRSPSAAVVRMFEMTAVADPVQIEHSQVSHRRLGAEQSVEIGSVPTGVGLDNVARHAGINTTIPADADVVDGALRLVVALARATVRGADGVSVSLRRHGKLATVAASDQTISDMDACQYATGEGPCIDASVGGRWFHAESLGTETRWPAFTPGAQALGINAILSSPLLAEDEPVGALNIYSRSAMAFAPDAQELASIFASEASLLLGTAGVVVTDEQLSTRLGEALRLRRVVAQAEGVIMEREGVGADRAYRILCDFSRQSNQPLREHAQSVAASTKRSRPEPEPAPTGRHHG